MYFFTRLVRHIVYLVWSKSLQFAYKTLTLLLSEQPKLHRVVAVLSAIGLIIQVYYNMGCNNVYMIDIHKQVIYAWTHCYMCGIST